MSERRGEQDYTESMNGYPETTWQCAQGRATQYENLAAAAAAYIWGAGGI